MMKLWLLFIFDLAAILFTLRAVALYSAARKLQPGVGEPYFERDGTAWLNSQIAVWLGLACIFALGAFCAAVLPG